MFRHLTLLLLTLLTLLPAAAQEPTSDLLFEPKIHNFGTFSETGGKVTHRFTFTNRGTKAVTLARARVGCSCVKVEVGRRPVPPGRTGYVDVTYDPDYRPGEFSKEIAVFTTDNRYTYIWVKGVVTPGKHPVTDNCPYPLGHGLYSNYKRILLGDLAPGTPRAVTLRLGSDARSTITVRLRLDVKTDGAPAAKSSRNNLDALPFSIKLPTSTMLRPDDQTEIKVELRTIAPFRGRYTVNLIPIVNGYPATPIPLQVDGSL